MEFGRYYVVSVSHFKTNPVHRAIVQCTGWTYEGHPLVEFITSSSKETEDVRKLPHFEVIEEIEEMKE